MIKRENYINIQGWMKTDLCLTGNELLAYSIIFGFSQDGESQYQNGVKYISDWIGCSYPTAISVLKRLHEKGLIEKEEVINEKGRFVNYRVLNNLTTTIKNFNNPPIKNFNTEIKDIIDNIKSNIKPAVEKWIQYKKERKESYKPTGLSDCIKKIEKLSNGNGELAMQIVEQSTSNGWSGLFPLKNEGGEKMVLIDTNLFYLDDTMDEYRDLFEGVLNKDELALNVWKWIVKNFEGRSLKLSFIRSMIEKFKNERGENERSIEK